MNRCKRTPSIQRDHVLGTDIAEPKSPSSYVAKKWMSPPAVTHILRSWLCSTGSADRLRDKATKVSTCDVLSNAVTLLIRCEGRISKPLVSCPRRRHMEEFKASNSRKTSLTVLIGAVNLVKEVEVDF